ncbi:hypothetical protein LZ30DRAFT_782545 [Colletotrichum cereale]|nr:hypothetical protein LZ30DRAFT_782545 [Colletotrichum cereale]
MDPLQQVSEPMLKTIIKAQQHLNPQPQETSPLFLSKSPIEEISAGLVNLNLQAPASPKSTPSGPEDEEFHEWKRPIPSIDDDDDDDDDDDGKPGATIWECPDQRELDYEADWYHLASAPDFLVCTRCHEMYLCGTPFAASLERVRQASGRCRFNVPRITRLLLPEYVKHIDDGPIREFMSSRLSVLDCKGRQGSRGGAGIKWFKTLDSRLEGAAGELVEFSRQRHGVYVQTVLQVQMLRQMQELQ